MEGTNDMATIQELATQTAAILNATRKGEQWMMSVNGFGSGQTYVVQNDALQVRLSMRLVGPDRVRLTARLIGNLADHQPSFSTRNGTSRGWKQTHLKLSRGIEALTLKALGYITTTAIAGREAAVARRDAAIVAAAAREAHLAAERAADEAAVRAVYAEAPHGAQLHRRWYSDAFPGRISIQQAERGTAIEVTTATRPTRMPGDAIPGQVAPARFDMSIGRVSTEVAAAIIALLRGSADPIGADAANATVSNY